MQHEKCGHNSHANEDEHQRKSRESMNVRHDPVQHYQNSSKDPEYGKGSQQLLGPIFYGQV